ncbi:GNAT family protein [Streptomyces sp. NPDC006540]|uniref:GNAT family N-acetyltransferase n=1 Tax=Streptomyces sp. NPDC006540 TaxID=3155353 RepID=UPI0033B4BAC4
MTSTLRTERLLLERYVPEDEDGFVALFQDARASRWMGDGPSAEAIIYALAPEVWGSGLGAEVAKAIVAHGFGTLGLTEVHATVAASNKASPAVLDKIGFEYVREITEDDGSKTRVLTRRRARLPQQI